MDESLFYNGSGLFSGVDFPREALGFFRAAGHTTASTPRIVADDILYCIYSELKFTAFFDRNERSAFLCINSLSHLFTLQDDVFYDPMYAAAITMFFASPVVLGSWWALIPMLAFLAGIIFRIRNEEKVLCGGLDGYTDYMKKVRYRLIPFIW